MIGVAAPSVLDVADGELVFQIRGSTRHGQLVRLKSIKCTIGSGPRCTLRLRVRGVQPLHCLILRGTAGTVIRRFAPDTRLNGRAFNEAELVPGDRIGIGPIEFELLCSSPLPNAPLGHRSRRLIEELRSARKQVAQLEQDRLRWENEQAESERQLQHFLEQLHQRSKQIDAESERFDVRQGELDTRQAALDARQGELDSRQSELDARQTDLDACQGEPDTRRVELDARRQELNTRQDELGARQADLDARQNELSTRQAELDARQTDLDARQGELDTRRVELDARRQELNTRQDELGARQADLDARQDELSTRQAELDGRQRELDSRQGELNTRRVELDTRQDEVDGRQDELDTRQAELDAGQAELGTRQDALNAREAELAARQLEISEKCRQIEARWAEAEAGRQGTPKPSAQEEDIRFEEPSHASPQSAEEVLRRAGLTPSFDEEGADEQWSTSPGPIDRGDRGTPETSGSPPKPDEDQEESIDDYMTRLFDRVRETTGRARETAALRGSLETAADRQPTPPSDSEPTGPTFGRCPPPGPPAAAITPRKLPERAPRAVAPEKSVDLAAMRELANSSAQAAISHHARRKLIGRVAGKLLVALAALATGVILVGIWWLGSANILTLCAAGASLLVGLGWGVECILLRRRAAVSGSGLGGRKRNAEKQTPGSTPSEVDAQQSRPHGRT